MVKSETLASLAWSIMSSYRLTLIDLVQPKMTPTLSFSGMDRKYIFIVGIGPILNKELEFIFGSVRSDCICVYI